MRALAHANSGKVANKFRNDDIVIRDLYNKPIFYSILSSTYIAVNVPKRNLFIIIPKSFFASYLAF